MLQNIKFEKGVKNFMLKKIAHKLKRILSMVNDRCHIYMYKKLPIVPNKIVFSNYLGRSYGCNPKYITEELLKRNENYDIVWLINKNTEETSFPDRIRLVRTNTHQAYKELATAKIWVDNYHKVKSLRIGLTKKNEQFYIQTWHGSLGIKKIEKTVKSLTDNKTWLKYAKLNSLITDYWISNSKFETKVYRESLWQVKSVLELGHPRNDIFFYCDHIKGQIKEKVFSTLKVAKNKKIILYVPSFRDDEGIDYYNLDYNKVLNILSNKFSSDWICLVRLHPRVQKYDSLIIPKQENIVNVTFYPDIQELLVSSDVLITDYSSCVFDFMLTRRPAFIFATDIAKFNKERGFYYPLEQTPFSIAENNEQLLLNIRAFDLEKYQNQVEFFLKEKGCMEDGHASERVVNLLEKIMKG